MNTVTHGDHGTEQTLYQSL